MRKISESGLKKAIIAAETQRLKSELSLAREGAKLQKLRESSEKITAAWLKKSGLDLAGLEALHARRAEELERVLARHKADALRLAARNKNKLHAEIAAQSSVLRDLAMQGDFFPYPSFSLEKPFLIWTTPLTDLSDSSIAPFDSWAKFKFKTSASGGTQKISFYFYWANPFHDYAVINAATFLSSTGHLRSHASWGWSVNSAEVLAWARFGIWLGVQNDVNAAGYVSEFLGRAGSLSAPLIGSDTTGASVSAGSSLCKTMFAVPPGNVAVFEVAIAFDYENDDGDIEADFESGDFRIACPVVVFSLLNSPAH